MSRPCETIGITQSANKNRPDHLKDKYLHRTNYDIKKTSVKIRYIEAESKIEGAKYATQLLDTLPSKQKEVFYLRNYMNLNFKDIGKVMDLSEQVVRKHNYRAIKSLRSQPLSKLNNL